MKNGHVINTAIDGRQLFWCPGCECCHWFISPRWTWNGDFIKPTVTPSILITLEGRECHLWIKEGKIEYLNDCHHELAGKTVNMEEV